MNSENIKRIFYKQPWNNTVSRASVGGGQRVWLTGVPALQRPRGQALPDRARAAWRGDSERRNRRHDTRSSRSPNTPWSPPAAEETEKRSINNWRVCTRHSINTDITTDRCIPSHWTPLHKHTQKHCLIWRRKSLCEAPKGGKTNMLHFWRYKGIQG